MENGDSSVRAWCRINLRRKSRQSRYSTMSSFLYNLKYLPHKKELKKNYSTSHTNTRYSVRTNSRGKYHSRVPVHAPTENICRTIHEEPQYSESKSIRERGSKDSPPIIQHLLRIHVHEKMGRTQNSIPAARNRNRPCVISDLLNGDERTIQENILFNALTNHMISAIAYFEDMSWLSYHNRFHFQSLKLTDTYLKSLLPHASSTTIPPTSMLMHCMPWMNL